MRQRSQRPLGVPTGGVGDRYPPDGLRPGGARVKRRADLRRVGLSEDRSSFVSIPSIPAVAALRSTRLSTKARFSRARNRSTDSPRRGERRCRVAWIAAALRAGAIGLHAPALSRRRPTGLASVKAAAASTHVLHLDFAFGPSRRPSIPPVLRPLPTSPPRASASRPPPSRPTRRTRHPERRGVPRLPRRPPGIRPGTFIAHPPHLRCNPLMASGFAVCGRLARTAPSSYAVRVPRVAVSPRASFPPRLTTTQLPSGVWLVPSTSTGDSHPRAAGHGGRTRGRPRPAGRGRRTTNLSLIYRAVTARRRSIN
jgi:hypothetical protein